MDAPFSLLLSSLSRSVSHAKNARAGTTRAAKQARLTFTPCIALECFIIFVFQHKKCKNAQAGSETRSQPAKWPSKSSSHSQLFSSREKEKHDTMKYSGIALFAIASSACEFYFRVVDHRDARVLRSLAADLNFEVPFTFVTSVFRVFAAIGFCGICVRQGWACFAFPGRASGAAA